MKARHFIPDTLMLLLLAGIVPAFPQESEHAAVEAGDDAAEAKNAVDTQGFAAALAPQTFTTGSGDSFLRVAITERGTISLLESPAGKVHINGREGYAVASFDGTGNGRVTHGFDSGNAEAGWGAPTVSQPSGAGKLPLIITRTSLDGQVQLKQTFTLSTTGERSVDIKMEVKNLSPVRMSLIELCRYFDGDIDGKTTNVYGNTAFSVWGTGGSSAEGSGTPENLLMLTGIPASFAAYFPRVEQFQHWDPNGQVQTARSTVVAADITPSITPRDSVGRLFIEMGTTNPGQARSVTVRYRRF